MINRPSHLHAVAAETPAEQARASPVLLSRHKTTGLLPQVGERLVEMGAITRDQLQIALHEQRQCGLMLGTVLVRLGFLDEAALASVLAARTGLEPIDLKKVVLDPALLQRLPKETAKRCHAVPLRLDDLTLVVAMADPYDIVAMDALRRHFPRNIELIPHVASKADIEDVIDHYYGFATSLDDVLRELETGQTKQAAETAGYQHPLVRLVNMLLFDAVKRGASDVHLEPENSFVRVRYRIDGYLHQVRALHRTHWPALSHRLKIMAGMNIADTRSIQDGRFQLQIGGSNVDFRVAIMPTVWGENIVVRLLDHRRSLLPLIGLGFDGAALAGLERIMERPQGITLVTGPTGSGKTTTLYSILRQLSSVDVNIATLEEPVEYQLDLIRQTAVQEAQGLTFAAGVRGVLRMDPDIIFIGEVRDGDTAQMALRAAMTGHQVYSTLHCNDALGALPRLVDLGLNPRVIAGNISGVIAQRLVRKLCPHCKQNRRATAEECRVLRVNQAEPPMIAEAKGCDYCMNTGRKGRTVIAEVLRVTPAFDDMIAADAGRLDQLRQARSDGFRSMQEDGIARVLSGDIALADLRRAVDMTRGD
ncbi:MAG: GspE/PulE family protein [Alphaproteobacteria bacterium]|nr:GspE/PulE family protein [Alphaproteobacteria bacterium]